MKEHYTTYNQAVKLKELGFDWKCDYCYLIENGELSFEEVDVYAYEKATYCGCDMLNAPTLSLAQAWLREEKGIDIEVVTILNLAQKTKSYKANLCYFGKNESGEDCANYKIACLNIHSYEKALELGIDKALELLTNKS